MSDQRRESERRRAFESAAVKPMPQLVFRLDAQGRVIDKEDRLAGTMLECIPIALGHTVHQCLHPACASSECRLQLSLEYVLQKIDDARILEWELRDAIAGRTIRLHMRRAAMSAETWATLTVTDISEGRRFTGTLQETNTELAQLLSRSASDRARQISRLDRKLRTLSGELIIAQETERRRIAVELHDGLGQWLSMAKLSVEAGMQKTQDRAGIKDFERAFSHLTTAIREVRSIVGNLRPSMLEEFGLPATLELLCHELQLSNPTLQLRCRIDGDAATLEMPQCVAMVRILQEALNNIAKHSHATKVQVEALFRPDKASLRVTDNGQGLSAAQHDKHVRGVGLANMRERAKQSNGRCYITSAPGEGLQVLATWRHDPAGTPQDFESGTYKAITDGIGRDSSGIA